MALTHEWCCSGQVANQQGTRASGNCWLGSRTPGSAIGPRSTRIALDGQTDVCLSFRSWPAAAAGPKPDAPVRSLRCARRRPCPGHAGANERCGLPRQRFGVQGQVRPAKRGGEHPQTPLSRKVGHQDALTNTLRSRDVPDAHASRSCAAQHVSVAQAMQARDADAAEQAMRAHIAKVQSLVLAGFGSPSDDPGSEVAVFDRGA